MNTLQSYKHSVLLAPITKTSGSTATAYFDSKGYRLAEVLVTIGALKNTNGVPPKTIKLQESDDTVATNFADISGASVSAGPTAGGQVRFNVDLRKRKRYIQLSFTPETTTNDDQIVSSVVLLGRGEQLPSDTNGFGDTTVKIV